MADGKESNLNLDKAGRIRLEGDNVYVDYWDWGQEYKRSESKKAILTPSQFEQLLKQMDLTPANSQLLDGQMVLFSIDENYKTLVEEIQPLRS